jgi:hypothetical protein
MTQRPAVYDERVTPTSPAAAAPRGDAVELSPDAGKAPGPTRIEAVLPADRAAATTTLAAAMAKVHREVL